MSWSVREFRGMKDLPMASSSTLRCGHPKSARSAIICGRSGWALKFAVFDQKSEEMDDAEGL